MSQHTTIVVAAVGTSLIVVWSFLGMPFLMWWPLRCFSLPWHRIISRWQLTEQSEKVKCSCGKAFGINHSVRAVLPWDAVKELYEGPGSILRPPQRRD